MSFDAVALLKILRIFLVIVGAITAAWGAYDMFGDSGAQSSAGTKKIFGGISFAAISWIVMTWAIADVGAALEV